MKKFLLMAFVLLVAACAKEDNGVVEPQKKVIQIEVADFPMTRADSFGKTAWEAGDELLIGYMGVAVVQDYEQVAEHSAHKLTFDGKQWTLDTPLEVSENVAYVGLEVFYAPGRALTYSDAHFQPMHLCYLPEDLDGSVSDYAPYFLHEYLSAMFILDDNNKLLIDFSSNSTSLLEIYRSNRIRINYKNTADVSLTVKMTNAGCPVAFGICENVGNCSVTTTTDEDGNAFVYLLCGDSSIPSLQVFNGSKAVSKVVTLPDSSNGKAYSLTIE